MCIFAVGLQMAIKLNQVKRNGRIRREKIYLPHLRHETVRLFFSGSQRMVLKSCLQIYCLDACSVYDASKRLSISQ